MKLGGKTIAGLIVAGVFIVAAAMTTVLFIAIFVN